MNILFIGDIVGKAGRRILKARLPGLREKFAADVVIANAENAAGGFGLTRKTLDEIRAAGVDVVTSGNHIWDKKEIVPILDEDKALLRPANYAPGLQGRGVARIQSSTGGVLWVINLQGRVLMPPVDCPFRKVDEILKNIPTAERCVFVDFHAEATSEKEAMGLYLDGRVSVLAGTHTHVPTADAGILPGGSGYVTDVGMTGAHRSVIGMRFEDAMERLLRGIPKALNTAKGDVRIQGLAAGIDDSNGYCVSLERIEVFGDR